MRTRASLNQAWEPPTSPRARAMDSEAAWSWTPPSTAADLRPRRNPQEGQRITAAGHSASVVLMSESGETETTLGQVSLMGT